MISKKLLREKVADLRKNQDTKMLEEKSIDITNKIIQLPVFEKAQAVMCYMDFRNEVMTKYIIKHCLEHGKSVLLPLVDVLDGVKCIVPYEITNLQRDVACGAFGILEPKRECTKPFAMHEIDFVIVPGVAFDICGNRMGYGAGMYDRFLGLLQPECAKAGIAFEFQIFDNVPVEPHDILLDVIITEQRIIGGIK